MYRSRTQRLLSRKDFKKNMSSSHVTLVSGTLTSKKQRVLLKRNCLKHQAWCINAPNVNVFECFLQSMILIVTVLLYGGME